MARAHGNEARGSDAARARPASRNLPAAPHVGTLGDYREYRRREAVSSWKAAGTLAHRSRRRAQIRHRRFADPNGHRAIPMGGTSWHADGRTGRCRD